MQAIKIESKQTLSRKDAAAWLSALAKQLAGKDDVEIDREGMQLTFGVADEIELEVELEVEDGKTELEIELHW
jgi:amphi-Trp domain-containing protein